MVELYDGGLPRCAKKARLCLKEKGLAYESHYLRLARLELHEPAYLALNPNGLVPTLVHDGEAIIESGVINEYVDEIFPDMPVRPADPRTRARMRVLAKMADEYGLAAQRIPTWTRTKQAQLKAMDQRTFDKMVAETPLADHRLKLQALRGGGFSEKEFADAYARMDYVYDRCETALADGPWLVGAGYSLADIALLPYVDS